MQKWEVVEGNLASPRGFRGAAAAAGIKKKHGELDLAMLVCDAPSATAAGVFTTNLVAAAPVLAILLLHGRYRWQWVVPVVAVKCGQMSIVWPEATW